MASAYGEPAEPAPSRVLCDGLSQGTHPEDAASAWCSGGSACNQVRM